MLDVIDSEADQLISDHVIRMHRYRNPKEADGEPLSMGSSYADSLSFSNDGNKQKDTEIYERYDALLHGKSRNRHEKILSVDFMRKYIHIAKCMKPKLSEAACEAISNEYSRLRAQENVQSDVARTQPITARTLETLIRLSTAHARARLSKTVGVEDADAAIELVQFAYFKKVLEKEKNQKRRRDASSSNDEQSDEGEDMNGIENGNGTATRQSKRTRRTTGHADIGYDSDEDIETPQPDTGDLTVRTSRSSVSGKTKTTDVMESQASKEPAIITDERLETFKSSLQLIFREAREQSLSLIRITAKLNEQNSPPFTTGEIEAAMHRMTEDNQIMLADGIVFLI